MKRTIILALPTNEIVAATVCLIDRRELAQWVMIHERAHPAGLHEKWLPVPSKGH